YDWRDVFRQPRDRELIDVADDLLTSVRMLFDRKQRHALRQQRQLKRRSPANILPPAWHANDDLSAVAGAYADRVRRAQRERAHIQGLLDAGGQTHQHVTSLAMEALSLADSVDRALFVADEMARGVGARSAGASPAR